MQCFIGSHGGIDNFQREATVKGLTMSIHLIITRNTITYEYYNYIILLDCYFTYDAQHSICHNQFVSFQTLKKISFSITRHRDTFLHISYNRSPAYYFNYTYNYIETLTLIFHLLLHYGVFERVLNTVVSIIRVN